jgi:hypothetical protein
MQVRAWTASSGAWAWVLGGMREGCSRGPRLKSTSARLRPNAAARRCWAVRARPRRGSAAARTLPSHHLHPDRGRLLPRSPSFASTCPTQDTLEQRVLDALVCLHPKSLTGAQLAKLCGHFKLKSKVRRAQNPTRLPRPRRAPRAARLLRLKPAMTTSSSPHRQHAVPRGAGCTREGDTRLET